MPDDNDEELINCDGCSNEMSQDDSFTTGGGEVVCSDCVRLCEYSRARELPMMSGIM